MRVLEQLTNKYLVLFIKTLEDCPVAAIACGIHP